LLYIDGPLPEKALKDLRDTGLFKQVKELEFEVA
jgi:D-3-phosphoglycerate dehydrogenase